MKKIMNKVRNLHYGALAFLTVGAMQSEAMAADSKGIGQVATDIKGQLGNVGQLAVAGMFLVGLFFLGAGLLRLKAAADTQGNQVKYGEGLWRLAIAAGLIGIPWLTGTLGQTLGFDPGVTVSEGGNQNF